MRNYRDFDEQFRETEEERNERWRERRRAEAQKASSVTQLRRPETEPLRVIVAYVRDYVDNLDGEITEPDASAIRACADALEYYATRPIEDGWMPIESAPHNQAVLLGWRDWRDGQWCMEIGAAATGERFDNGYSNRSHHGSATYWRLCPAPPADALTGEALHPDTAALVSNFAVALAAKLRNAEQKYGYSNGWLTDNWEAECRQQLDKHVAKGDPLDVAAYAAFMWRHGWRTAPATAVREPDAETLRQQVARLREALNEAVTAMRSFSIFVRTKERAHEHGVELYDSILAKLGRAALADAPRGPGGT